MRGIEIAIVDDDPSVTKALCRLFVQLGAEPVAFRSGLEFLASLRYAVPDVVIIDLQMPQFNGWALFAELERLQTHTKKILITGDDDCNDHRLRLPGAIVLSKPLDQASLLAAINQTYMPTLASRRPALSR
jgi:two-component system response regulator FixJ